MLGKDIFAPQPESAEWLAKTVFSDYQIPVFLLWISIGVQDRSYLLSTLLHCEPIGQWKGG